MTLIIIAVTIAITVCYLADLKLKAKKIQQEEKRSADDLLKEMVLTLPENERAEFVATHFKKFYQDKAFYEHVENILPSINPDVVDEFLLDYARTGIHIEAKS
jgi:hypothetical protein